jgi:ubiquinone biosynthesis protein
MVSVVGKSLANAEGSLRHLYPKLKLSEVLRTVLPDVMRELVQEMLTFEQAGQYALDLLNSANRAPGDIQRVSTDLSDRMFAVWTRNNLTDKVPSGLLQTLTSPLTGIHDDNLIISVTKQLLKSRSE